jgi:4'-phosphopantetheinyl transferase
MEGSRFAEYLDLMPDRIKSEVRRYRRWQDAHACLLGKLLLLQGLVKFGYPGHSLDGLLYTPYNRPYLQETLPQPPETHPQPPETLPHVPQKIDFNISHSGDLVVCAISDDCQVGVDVERVDEIALSDFKNIWTDAEWQDIQSPGNGLTLFYRYWTMKEAAIKADGRGLNISLPDVILEKDKATIAGATWMLRELFLDPSYVAHISFDRPLLESLEINCVLFN